MRLVLTLVQRCFRRAVSGRRHDANGSDNAGHTRLSKFSGNDSDQDGADIVGSAVNDELGVFV